MAGENSHPARPPAFVLDGSVALAWFFEDEDSAYADSVQDAFAAGASAAVPVLWPFEVANSLLVGERRKRVTAEKTARFVALLGTLAIRADDESASRVWTDTIALARRHGLTVYDAAYLELAVRLAAPLATLDKQLLAAAPAANVPIFRP
ncbi:MAG: type II toxin-antitoxin system VapC family toxin [Gemmataceae bacterium]|nr:type II toxin-antitoxin system VapC family toxin [Gemmataceae bacterium]